MMNLGGQDDTVRVKSLSGPMIINGDGGNDTCIVSSDESKLSLINALLAFDVSCLSKVSVSLNSGITICANQCPLFRPSPFHRAEMMRTMWMN